ncbi:MAG: hypothetical protein ACFFB5_02315 [Promethearchaeota archaeon]
MFELIFIGLLLFGAIYVFFFLIYSSIKEEKDFARDVYRYLSRRYPSTVIVDYGGISSDPIIHSRNAGPFKLIEVKVITEKEAKKTDRDLILRGEIDPQKFKKGERSINLSLDPQYRWNRNVRDIEIGIPQIDRKFIISSNDAFFPRHLLTQTDLGALMQKSFDLEGYFIRWLPENPVVQVRMETMTSNSFIQAFNILLGTVGALSEKGFLTRSIGKIIKPEVHIFPEKPTLTIDEVVEKKELDTKLIATTAQEEIISKPEKPILSWTSTDNIKSHTVHDLGEVVESPYKPLFSSISYQAKKIEYQSNSVKILTFSGAAQEIIVTFPENDRALFTTLTGQSPSEVFKLQIEFQEKARSTDWSDSWKDISISGPPDIVAKLHVRTGIAHRISNTGEIMAIVEGQPNRGIEYKIEVPKTIRGINSGYSLLKDIIWFFEIIFM